MVEDEETLSIEAHRITITYGFDTNGAEFVTLQSDGDISNILLIGILEIAKNRTMNPELYETADEEEPGY